MFTDLSIKARLVFILTFLSVLLLVIGIIGLNGMSKTEAGLKTVYEDRTIPLFDLGLVLDMVNRIRTHAVIAASATEPAVAQQQNADTLVLDAEIETIWTKYMGTVLTPDEEKLADAFAAQWKTYQASRNVTLGQAMEGDFEAARDNAASDAGPKFAAARETMHNLLALQGEVAKQEFDLAEARFVNSRNITIAAIAIGLGLAAWLGFLLIRAITGPLDAAVKLARAVAEGDLTQRIEVHSTNEIGQLMQALKDMNDSLVKVVGQVRSGVDTVATASSQIAAGNLDLSSRTEEQASSLEETASSMEELTSTVRQNAENARQANQLVVATADVAVKGGKVVSQVVDTMASIKDSSRKI
ncbi:MAG: MCP four helix bundle domain-containing protein, partial [Thiobacillus sp.]|nr:MCP four helix bundle domain-containing protein [Thiobacillus sp.]